MRGIKVRPGRVMKRESKRGGGDGLKRKEMKKKQDKDNEREGKW